MIWKGPFLLLESLQLEFLITQVILAYGKTSCKHYRHAFSVMSKDVLYAFPITWKFYQLIKSMLFSHSVVSLCDPMDCSPPDSSVHRIFQARILEWVAISYSRGSSQTRDWTHVSCVSWIGRWIFYHFCHEMESVQVVHQFQTQSTTARRKLLPPVPSTIPDFIRICVNVFLANSLIFWIWINT